MRVESGHARLKTNQFTMAGIGRLRPTVAINVAQGSLSRDSGGAFNHKLRGLRSNFFEGPESQVRQSSVADPLMDL